MTNPDPASPQRWRHLAGFIFIVVAVIVLAVAFAQTNRPVVCADCEDPYRAESTSCDEELWNPTIFTIAGEDGYFHNLACSL